MGLRTIAAARRGAADPDPTGLGGRESALAREGYRGVRECSTFDNLWTRYVRPWENSTRYDHIHIHATRDAASMYEVLL
jgi:hypothetical protein